MDGTQTDKADRSCCAALSRRAEDGREVRGGVGSAFRRPFGDSIVRLPGGKCRIGTDDPILPQDGEGPSRMARIRPFAIASYAVTNLEFAAFASASGYRTDAERFGWSYVFEQFLPETLKGGDRVVGAPWWCRVEGASWCQPEGPASTIDDRASHPVVHVSWNDGNAYAAWAGGRLPGEAEWEYAAQGGRCAPRFPWGDVAPDDESFMPCNIWQGAFPHSNTAADGHLGTAPVDAFAPNDYGLYNMAGNVWEWCADAFRVRSLRRAARRANDAARREDQFVIKGGSYLCHRSYCYRYRIAARLGLSPDSSTGHLGFRMVFDS